MHGGFCVMRLVRAIVLERPATSCSALMRETALIRKFSTVITTPVHPGGSDPSSVVHAEEDLTLFSYVLTGPRRRSANVDHIQSGRCGWRSAHLAARATRQLMPAVLLGPYLAVFVGNVFGI
jgi:hypothetical protein